MGLNNSSGKKGKKKKKKRGGSAFPDPHSATKDRNAQSYGRISSSGNNFTGSYSANDFEDDITGSKSLTSLGDLPAPLGKKKTVPAAV